MNQINNFNQINQLDNNFGMNFNNINNMFNFNNINQQPNFLNNNIPIQFSPFGMAQNGFLPVFLPQQNIMKEEDYYNVSFRLSNNSKKIFCRVLADSSIEDMIQIFKKRVSVEIKDFIFLFKAEKIDINSQLKIKELFHDNLNPNITVINPFNTYLIINFNSSSGIKTQVKYYGCLCCSSFWCLLKCYLNEIGLNESCLKDLKFIFNGNSLPNKKDEAMKYSSAKYGIQSGSTIIVYDIYNLIGKKINNN